MVHEAGGIWVTQVVASHTHILAKSSVSFIALIAGTEKRADCVIATCFFVTIIGALMALINILTIRPLPDPITCGTVTPERILSAPQTV